MKLLKVGQNENWEKYIDAAGSIFSKSPAHRTDGLVSKNFHAERNSKNFADICRVSIVSIVG